jgi:C_GCAxxG_C_C family probable redox protein
METRKQIAVEKKRCGLNCAQAVLCAYADLAGIDEETAIRLAAPFGAGMGNMEGTCGAITGAGLMLGLVSQGPATKQMRQIMNKFQERNGATQCKLLKGVGTGKVLRECSDCVADAAEFLEEEIGQVI